MAHAFYMDVHAPSAIQLGPGLGAVIEDLELIAFCAEKDELQDRVIFLPLR